MSRSIRCGRRRNGIGCGVPSGSRWRRAPPPRRARTAAGRSWPSVFLPISPADDVSVALAVPRGGSDTSGAKNILADPPDNGLWQLAEDLHVARYGEVRHPCTAKVQQLRVIQGAVRSHGDEQKDVVLTQVAWHTDHRSLEHRRMPPHHGLDFDRRDVLPAAAQRILHPVQVREILVAVQHTEIPGTKPLWVRVDSQTRGIHVTLAHDVWVARPTRDLAHRPMR